MEKTSWKMPQLRAPHIGVIKTQILMMPQEHDFIWKEKLKMRKEGLAKGKQPKVLDATSRDKWFSEWSEDSSGPMRKFQETQEIKKYFYNTIFA